MAEKKEQPSFNQEELLRQQIKLSEEILERVKYIKRYTIWQQVFSWFKFLLILIPLIIGLVYLPPLIQQLIDTYTGILGGAGNISSDLLKFR